MPLNASEVAKKIASAYAALYEDYTEANLADMAAAWESAIHTDAMAGQNPIAKASPPANSAIIKSAILACHTSQGSNVDVLANMFASYWATSHLTPIPPCVGITGNDAMSKVSAYRSAIQSSIVQQIKEPHFDHLFKAVEAVTKTIVWTGVSNTGSPMFGNVS